MPGILKDSLPQCALMRLSLSRHQTGIYVDNVAGGNVCMKIRLYVAWHALVLTLYSCVALAQIPRFGGSPYLKGNWQAMNFAKWNLEYHSAV